ncbi:hypothetical protein, partial [Senimuribacter intestinalis]|uniref:hypothetical protein n=1 Tax=Senimuribacter intestinalis TaxID=2941507 RepID=UPI00203CEC96
RGTPFVLLYFTKVSLLLQLYCISSKVGIRQQVRASFSENEFKYGVWRVAGAMYTKKRLEYGVFQGVNARYTKKS